MEKYLSKRALNTKPSPIRKFFDLANEIEGVISLGVGEPDFDTPWSIRAEAIHAIKQGYTFYTANMGLLELRKEIAHYLKRRFNLSYNYKDEILVTVGASEGIDLVMRALVNPGDEVIIVQPSYVAYEPIIQLSGGIPVIIDCKEEDHFKLTYEALKEAISDKTKLLLINYPSNPTGGIMNHEDYAKLVSLIKENDIIVLSDEIYSELNYDNKHSSLAEFEEIKDQIIVMNGFSKAYAMTGWRLGYLCGHKELIHYICRIHQHTIMCPTTFCQYAAIEASKNGDERCVEMKDSFEQRRNFLVNNLRRIGLSCALPQGAFYVFPNITSTKLTSEEFCMQLLEEEKVAVVPGNAFGTSGEGFIRISYAYSLDEIKEALVRIERFISKRI